MTLDEWLESKKMTEVAFGAMIGCSQSAVHRYRRYGRIPRPEIILRIKAATDGYVTEMDWYSEKNLAGAVPHPEVPPPVKTMALKKRA